MFAAGTFDPALMWGAAYDPAPAFTGLGERPGFVAEQICLCQCSKCDNKNHIVRYRKRNWCVMRPSNLPAPSLRAVNRLPAVRLSFWVLAFDIKGVSRSEGRGSIFLPALREVLDPPADGHATLVTSPRAWCRRRNAVGAP